jgi:hypothetical protein
LLRLIAITPLEGAGKNALAGETSNFEGSIVLFGGNKFDFLYSSATLKSSAFVAFSSLSQTTKSPRLNAFKWLATVCLGMPKHIATSYAVIGLSDSFKTP